MTTRRIVVSGLLLGAGLGGFLDGIVFHQLLQLHGTLSAVFPLDTLGGLFNVIEGLVDHYLLGIHHVVERLQLSTYDHAFVAFGLLLAVLGYALMRGHR